MEMGLINFNITLIIKKKYVKVYFQVICLKKKGLNIIPIKDTDYNIVNILILLEYYYL